MSEDKLTEEVDILELEIQNLLAENKRLREEVSRESTVAEIHDDTNQGLSSENARLRWALKKYSGPRWFHKCFDRAEQFSTCSLYTEEYFSKARKALSYQFGHSWDEDK